MDAKEATISKILKAGCVSAINTQAEMMFSKMGFWLNKKDASLSEESVSKALSMQLFIKDNLEL